MLRRKKALILVPAVLLIPILLGMTPLSMAHKLANGALFAHCKEARCHDNCPFNSLTSHDDLPTGLLASTPLDREIVHSHNVRIPVFYSLNLNTCFNFNPVPLLC